MGSGFAAALVLVLATRASADLPCDGQALSSHLLASFDGGDVDDAIKTLRAAEECGADSRRLFPWFSGRGSVETLVADHRHRRLEGVAGVGASLHHTAVQLSGQWNGSRIEIDTIVDGASTLLYVLAGTEAHAFYSSSVADVPLRGLLLPTATVGSVAGQVWRLFVAPELLPQSCSTADDASQAEKGGYSLACAVGDEILPVRSREEARSAVQRQFALSAAEALDNARLPARRSLLQLLGARSLSQALDMARAARTLRQRRRGETATSPLPPSAAAGELHPLLQGLHRQPAPAPSPAPARRAYVAPTTSLGLRHVLALRVKFFGQADAVAAYDHPTLQQLMANVSAELNRTALGAAAFAVTTLPPVFELPQSVVVCSQAALTSVLTEAVRLSMAAYPSIDINAMEHVAIFLPTTCAAVFPWLGLAATPGWYSWMNVPDPTYFVSTTVHEIGAFRASAVGWLRLWCFWSARCSCLFRRCPWLRLHRPAVSARHHFNPSRLSITDTAPRCRP